ncbi:flagellar biosynthesis anti-sigma factor FlgM [Desulfopila inferna]|uniref:flagellar biosynthesis anti-sigma factor FlgM n=1 Tax=Desulfopila inferna TaxID=468528 RepID=UPI00196451D8|nr:flagellar biosynthesis anti-sigma factor FlgM [Desulfopila inferna]MBM9603000.1 flagellar biosynthesis anti-sigma factor FlgM [Desulfopila inferna]
MSIDFFGIGGPGQIGDLKNTQKSQSGKKTEAVQNPDQVQFSAVLQDVNKAKQSESTISAERAAKVQALKAQIAEGSYKPDLHKVASSLLQFIVEEK